MSVSAMKKLTVLASASDADAIVRRLMSLKCVEIRTTAAKDGLTALDSARYDGDRAKAERRLLEIRRALPILSAHTQRKSTLGRRVHRVSRAEFCADGRDGIAWRTVERTVEAQARYDAQIAERGRLEQTMQMLEPWLGYDAPLDDAGSEKTFIRLGTYPSATDPLEVRDELEQMGVYLEEVGADEHGLYVSVTALRSMMDEVDRALAARGFLRVTFPEIKTTARVAYEQAETQLGKIVAELETLGQEIRDCAELLDEVEILHDIEATNLAVAQQKRKLAATERCVVLDGWIPSQTEARVAGALSAFDCACETADPEEGEEPPVLLKNNRWAQSFEWVVGMYAYPKYGTFDPTMIMSIFYFIIFGLMFADVGYGLILMLACFGGVRLLRPREGMRRMLLMFGFCGIACVIMGILFGGWFGDLPIAIMKAVGAPTDTAIASFFSQGLWINPLNDPMTFLIISLGIGAIHLIAGMAVNFAVLCKKGRALEALCTIAPYWVLFGGLGTLAVDSTIGLYVTLAGAGLILCLNGYGQKKITSRIVKGLGGLYGLINYAADLLSYCRILALGMVAGVVAQVINMITALGTTGVIGFVFMLIVLLLGHGLNLAINILGTFVHTARLQYIEFFGKFYEDGGQPFAPALPVEEFSEEPLEVIEK